MDVVLDTSAAVAVVLNERSKGALVARTEEAELIAPTSLPIEIGNAFSAMFKRGRLSLEQALRAFAHYRRIPVQLVDIDMDASLGLADALAWIPTGAQGLTANPPLVRLSQAIGLLC
jgi:predicted nucleic acid-binding protein